MKYSDYIKMKEIYEKYINLENINFNELLLKENKIDLFNYLIIHDKIIENENIINENLDKLNEGLIERIINYIKLKKLASDYAIVYKKILEVKIKLDMLPKNTSIENKEEVDRKREEMKKYIVAAQEKMNTIEENINAIVNDNPKLEKLKIVLISRAKLDVLSSMMSRAKEAFSPNAVEKLDKTINKLKNIIQKNIKDAQNIEKEMKNNVKEKAEEVYKKMGYKIKKEKPENTDEYEIVTFKNAKGEELYAIKKKENKEVKDKQNNKKGNKEVKDKQNNKEENKE